MSSTLFITAFIRSAMDDGLSNAEILRQVNVHLKKMNLKPIPRTTVNTIVDKLLDEESHTAHPVTAVPPPTPKKAPAPPRINTDLIPKNLFDEEFDSDEEDEEYVPESEDESEDVPESNGPQKTMLHASIYMDHHHGKYFDQIYITRSGDKVCVIHYYDRASREDFDCPKTCFYASVDEANDYFKTFLKFVAIDQMPFRSLEFNIPFYPAISLTPSRLQKSKYRDLVVKALNEFVAETA